MSFALRPYQEEALASISTNLENGINKQLVVLPTGAGKTVIFSHLPKVLTTSLPMLVLAHRGELLTQAQDKILWSNPQLDVQIEKAELHADMCDVVVASVPTLGRAESERILKYPKNYFKSIVIDEAHHAAAPTYRRIIDYFNYDLLLGVTATPQRSDSVRLTDVFQEIVYYKTIQDLIQDGYLCRLVGYRVKTDTDISEVETNNGDYIASQLEEAINTPTRNASVVAAYLQIAPEKKAIVFASGVQHANDLALSFRQKVTTEVLLGTTSEEDRLNILQRFKTGETKVLVNVGVLTEGFDEPSVEAIILARPTRSSLLYTQIVGRGTRLFEGKQHCIIIDIADTTKGKKPLGLPTLLGLPPEFDLQGQDLLEVANEYKKLEQFCPGEAVRVLNPDDIDVAYKRIDLFMPPPPNEIVLQYSTFVWAEVGENDFHLGINNGESLRIYIDPLGRWTVELTQANSSSSKTTILGHVEDMREAFVRSDRWVMNNRSTSMTLIDSSAAWRSDGPTDAQKKLLKRIGVPVTSDMTKGTASQIISKYYEANPKPKWLDNKIQSKRRNW
jgi:ATP-dependent helicase IRC3